MHRIYRNVKSYKESKYILHRPMKINISNRLDFAVSKEHSYPREFEKHVPLEGFLPVRPVLPQPVEQCYLN